MGDTVAPVGSFNNEIGLPLTSLKVNAGTRFLVAEMGANHVGEIANLTSLVPPDIAVVLKVGVAHLGEFGSAERIAQAKSEIVRGLVPGGLTILNANDEHVAAMSAIAPADVLWFGLPQKEDAQLDTTALDVRCDDLDHPSFVLEDKTGRHANVTLGICGQHNVMNALAAATVAMTLGMPIDDVASGLSDVTSISPHRMAVSTVTKPETSFTLIDDSFNANPDSMKAGLDGLSRWHAGAEQQPFRIAVLGAMLELGPDEHRLHEDVGRYAVEGGADALVTVGSTSDEALDALAEAMAQGGKAVAADPTMVQWAHDAEQADRMVTRLATDHEGTVVLLKGSQEYIGTDACACDLMRPAMYGSYHHITVMGKEDAPCDHKYDIVGGLCENNDKFAVDRMLPRIDIGDLLVIHDAGAHGLAMGYNYNGKLRCAEVLLQPDGSTRLIRRAETPEDYFATMIWDD